jgi:hypothetical protein
VILHGNRGAEGTPSPLSGNNNIYFKGLLGGSKEIMYKGIINRKPPHKVWCRYLVYKNVFINPKLKSIKIHPQGASTQTGKEKLIKLQCGKYSVEESGILCVCARVRVVQRTEPRTSHTLSTLSPDGS